MNPPTTEDFIHDLNQLTEFKQKAMRWGVKPYPAWPEKWKFGNGEVVKLDLRLVSSNSLKIAFGQD